jgi:hypothetical protein
VPGWSATEITIGDAADALTDDEVGAIFRRLLTLAGT